MYIIKFYITQSFKSLCNLSNCTASRGDNLLFMYVATVNSSSFNISIP